MNSNRYLIATAALAALALAIPSSHAQATAPMTTTQQTTTTTTTDPTAPTVAPLSKSQLKEQRKQQKHAEKSANESAKAQKATATAMKHQNKALDEKEKQQGTAPVQPPPPQL